MTREELIKAGYLVGNKEGTLSPFDGPPNQIPAHVASVILLLAMSQRKRKERQTMAEVGVWQGNMSRWLLTCMPYLTLHMIDPWMAGVPGTPWYDKGDKFGKKPQEQHDIHYQLCCTLAKQYKPRARILRQPSVEAAKQFADGSLDLVFIDAAHEYEDVCLDIKAWHKKVRPGGYLSGHDYRPDGNYFGVVRGVNETTAELGLKIDCWPGKVWACKIPGGEEPNAEAQEQASEEPAKPAEPAQVQAEPAPPKQGRRRRGR